MDGALCFFVPYLSSSPQGSDSATDLFAVGKTAYICLLGVVNLELAIVSRYWTWWFGIAVVVSWLIGFPFIYIYSAVEKAFNSVEMSAYGMETVFGNAWFWLVLLTVYLLAFVIRYVERSAKLLFSPDEVMVRAELEEAVRRGDPGANCDESVHGWGGQNGGYGENGNDKSKNGSARSRGGDSVFASGSQDGQGRADGGTSSRSRGWSVRRRGKGQNAQDATAHASGPDASRRSVQLAEAEAGRGSSAGADGAAAVPVAVEGRGLRAGGSATTRAQGAIGPEVCSHCDFVCIYL